MRAHFGPARRALVLAGGGITGGLWELGALIALEGLFADFHVGDFDVYVGTSAGALLAALVANGVTPGEIRDTLEHDRSTLPRLSGAQFLHVPWRRWLDTLPRLAAAVPEVARQMWHRWHDILVVDTVIGLTRCLPHGFFSMDGLEAYVREVLSEPGRTDSFAELDKRLLIPATALDSGQLHVFGSTRGERTPISRAVAASAAIPVVFEPVTIDGVDYVDGAVTKTANLGLAAERGAELIVVLNPLRPLVAEPGAPHIREGGALAVAGQSLRIAAQRRLHEGLRRHGWEHPGIDIVLLEPYERDVELFDVPLMTYDIRHEVVRRGYRTTVKTLLARWDHWTTVFARHGVRLATREVVERRARAWQHDVVAARAAVA
jgi:NTE family protein